MTPSARGLTTGTLLERGPPTTYRLALVSSLTYWQAVTGSRGSPAHWTLGRLHRYGLAKELLRGAANDHVDLRPLLYNEAADCSELL